MISNLDDEEPIWHIKENILNGIQGSFVTYSPASGRSFHLTQPFYRNIKLIGLEPSYQKESQTRKTCREFLFLNLLPAEKNWQKIPKDRWRQTYATILQLHRNDLHKQYHSDTQEIVHVFFFKMWVQIVKSIELTTMWKLLLWFVKWKMFHFSSHFQHCQIVIQI